MNPAEYDNLREVEETMWWFRGMRKILFHLLDGEVGKRRVRQALDAGCGTGAMARALSARYGWEMTGVDLRYVEMMQTLLTSAPGQPFAIATVASDRDTVLNWYFNNGYPDATFDADVKPVGNEQRMTLKYTVREGRRNFVREVLISGLGK